MAYNPSPKVAAARDFAKKFEANMVIILYVQGTDEDMKLGYASYGESSGLCESAKVLADVAYDAIMDIIEDVNR